jgi:hypothetical protein
VFQRIKVIRKKDKKKDFPFLLIFRMCAFFGCLETFFLFKEDSFVSLLNQLIILGLILGSFGMNSNVNIIQSSHSNMYSQKTLR